MPKGAVPEAIIQGFGAEYLALTPKFYYVKNQSFASVKTLFSQQFAGQKVTL